MKNQQIEEHHVASPSNSFDDPSSFSEVICRDQRRALLSFHNQIACHANHRSSDVVITTLQTLLTQCGKHVWQLVNRGQTRNSSSPTSPRRALVALSIYCISTKAIASCFRQHLRDLRQAAGATRNYVSCQTVHQHLPPTSSPHSSHDLTIHQLLQLVEKKRNENQKIIRAKHSELLSWNWPLRVTTIENHVRPKKKVYLKFVQNRNKKSCTRFSKVAYSTKKNPSQLHRLRIAGKKLRYALEFTPADYLNRSLRECKNTLRKMQNRLGNFTDHTAASEILHQFSKEPMTTCYS